MSLTQGTAVPRMPDGLIEYPVAADTVVHQGAIVGLASGYARPLQAEDPFIGIAYESSDNDGGAAGARKVRVQTRGVFRLPGAGFSQATVGAAIHAADDDEVTTTSEETSPIGRCVKYESATAVWVRIEP